MSGSSHKVSDIRNREIWIDVCRAIGILLVVLGHSGSPFTVYIFGFHIPLFFILSGYLYKDSGDFRPYLLKIFRHYLLPYFVLCGIVLVIQCIRDAFNGQLGPDIFKLYIRDIIVSDCERLPCLPLWYLTALFMALLIMYFIHLVRNEYVRFALAVMCLIISDVIARNCDFRLPWNITPALSGVFFIELGYVMRRLDVVNKIKSLKWYYLWAILISSFGLGMITIRYNSQISGDYVSLYDQRLLHIPLTVIGAVLLSVFMMILASILCEAIREGYMKPMIFLGRNTIIFMGFEVLAHTIAYSVTYVLIPSLMGTVIPWYMNFIISVIILTLAALLWNGLRKVKY